MHSEPAIESRAAARGRRRKRGNDSDTEGPVFVDNSGRRSKLLRRIGVLMGVGCLVYAVVLGAAFMGWGTSLNPSSLLPFGGNAQGGQGPGGMRPDGGVGNPVGLPGGTPPTGTASPSSSPSSSSSSSPSVSASAAAN
ncbi:hypothetical protein NFX46_03145 [Streptomyces phaeoluteigriseus]|uniref:Translation initiation factor IF-2 n=1 Tax=Streptomyces phaeoluteigriseus TaxID=114686 RepID=A0ABY4Z1C2_9ACTN|nr:hypothetical protein [Streptomyces phaeoluteigriseus]USQ82858.1 hypothetical protein NFX46_03145 [Streptomyces phaeoluteigriseus]